MQSSWFIRCTSGSTLPLESLFSYFSIFQLSATTTFAEKSIVFGCRNLIRIISHNSDFFVKERQLKHHRTCKHGSSGFLFIRRKDPTSTRKQALPARWRTVTLKDLFQNYWLASPMNSNLTIQSAFVLMGSTVARLLLDSGMAWLESSWPV